MFPYKDDNPTDLPPVVTVGIIAANVLAWLVIQGMGVAEPLARSVCDLGLVPGELLQTVKPMLQRHADQARDLLKNPQASANPSSSSSPSHPATPSSTQPPASR